MGKPNENQDHYVYVFEYREKILYVGSGRGSRINHVLSGISHNKYLNEFSFFCDRDYVYIHKIYEGLSKQDSLLKEQESIYKYRPHFNINGLIDCHDPEAVARAYIYSEREKFICSHYEKMYLDDDDD